MLRDALVLVGVRWAEGLEAGVVAGEHGADLRSGDVLRHVARLECRVRVLRTVPARRAARRCKSEADEKGR